jgi:hypothetical protein
MSQLKPKQIELTANGAIIIRDASGQTVELPPGTAGQVLTIVAGIPAYQTPAAASVDALDVMKYTVFNLGMG